MPVITQPRTSYSGHFLRRQGLLSSLPQVSTSFWRVTSLCLVPLLKFYSSEMHSLGVTGCGRASLVHRPPLLGLPGSQQPPPTAAYPAGTPHKTQAQGNCALLGASSRLTLLLPLVISGIFLNALRHFQGPSRISGRRRNEKEPKQDLK